MVLVGKPERRGKFWGEGVFQRDLVRKPGKPERKGKRGGEGVFVDGFGGET